MPAKQAVLQAAVAKFGGLNPAAAKLRVDALMVGLYIEGAIPVPDDLLARAKDFVFADLPASQPPQP